MSRSSNTSNPVRGQADIRMPRLRFRAENRRTLGTDLLIGSFAEIAFARFDSFQFDWFKVMGARLSRRES
jgi:succinate dehydrogenase flavin-adding protein (antitoxin of CptAB toxin-antitoxin module)